MDPNRGACRTRIRHALAFGRGLFYAALNRGRGSAGSEIPRRGRVIFLDPARFRSVACISLLLGLLDGDSIPVTVCGAFVCQSRILNVRSVVRSLRRQPFLFTGHYGGVDLDRARLQPDWVEDRQVDGKYRGPGYVGGRVIAGRGGSDGVDAAGFGDAHAYRSEMELGNHQFL